MLGDHMDHRVRLQRFVEHRSNMLTAVAMVCTGSFALAIVRCKAYWREALKQIQKKACAAEAPWAKDFDFNIYSGT